jgi:hypothetical protein
VNRFIAIAERVADDVALQDTIKKWSNVEDLHTDYAAMKMKTVRKKQTRDTHTFACTFYFDKLVYVAHWQGNQVVRAHGADFAKDAFKEVLQDMRQAIIRDITNHLQKRPPLKRIVGWDEADDFDDATCKVQSFRFGKITEDRGEVIIDGEVKLAVTARKLPDMSEGPYDQMSDRQMSQWIMAWAGFAPENFWMDGEYRGSKASRVRQLMKQWRGWTPRQQEKHYEDLKRWVR